MSFSKQVNTGNMGMMWDLTREQPRQWWSCLWVFWVMLESPLLLVVVTPSVNLSLKPALFRTCWHFDSTPCPPPPQTESKRELKAALPQVWVNPSGVEYLNLDSSPVWSVFGSNENHWEQDRPLWALLSCGGCSTSGVSIFANYSG